MTEETKIISLPMSRRRCSTCWIKDKCTMVPEEAKAESFCPLTPHDHTDVEVLADATELNDPQRLEVVSQLIFEELRWSVNANRMIGQPPSAIMDSLANRFLRATGMMLAFHATMCDESEFQGAGDGVHN